MQRGDVRALLKALRARVDPRAKTLGTHERVWSRHGRPVSQEELAEAIGVSRGWYSLLENGAPIRPSVALLDRIAAALGATPEERVMIFRLAIPELDRCFASAEASR
ncbi:MAG TPA: helix-turn-helix transcriptional regulator [Verrucomicrobiae bacterium]|nr:helix-turn-helix transcriptional regulator [Verrucomicrobiae bacterium]